MTLSRRRRAKANTGGRPRLSYFNTLCAHQYWTQRKSWFEVELISRYLIPISGIRFAPNSHCFQELAFTLLLYIRSIAWTRQLHRDTQKEVKRIHNCRRKNRSIYTIFRNFRKSHIKNKSWYRMCRRTGRNGIYIWKNYSKGIRANRRGPILPDERGADGRRELRRARILKQGRGQGDHIFLTDGVNKQRIYSRLPGRGI